MRFLAILAIFISSSLVAEDLTTTDGQVFFDVKVTRTSPTEIRFAHRNGIGSVNLSKLPAPWLAKYGKNGKADTAAEMAEATKRAADAQVIRQKLELRIAAENKAKDEFLKVQEVRPTNRNVEPQQPRRVILEMSQSQPQPGASNSMPFTPKRWTGHTTFVATTMQMTNGAMIVQRDDGTLLMLTGVPQKPLIADGQRVSPTIDPSTFGTTQYTDVSGAVRTIDCVSLRMGTLRVER